jgi:ABC-type branched-subunit amino acid transport system substrate-binding protein
MGTTRKAALATGLLALGFAISACSGSSDTKTNTGASGDGPKGSTVKIMLITPTGTQEANFPEELAAAKAGVDAVNKRNGFGGHKVELEYCNEKNDPAAAEACGRQAVSDKVIAVVGLFSRVGGIMPQLEKANIASVGSGGVSKDEITSKNAYIFGASLLSFAVCPAILADAGVTSQGMARFDVEASAVTETFAQAGSVAAVGKPLVKVAKVAPTNADYAPVAAQLAGAGVKGVSLSLTEQASVAFLQAGGSKFRYCHVDGGISDANLKSLTVAGPNYYAASSFYTINQNDKPVIKQFNDEVSAAAASDPDAKIRKSSQLWGWGPIHVLELILKDDTGEITSQTVIDRLKAQTALDTGFTVGPLDFSKDGPVPGLGRIVNLVEQGEQFDPATGAMVPTGKTYNVGALLAKAAAAGKK